MRYSLFTSLIIILSLMFQLSGCSKRQIVPGILAGVGGGLMVSGVAYRASLPDEDAEGLFGREPHQKAGIASLLFIGTALVLVGVIWSATTPLCDNDSHCWSGSKCDKASKTCVQKTSDEKKSSLDQASIMIGMSALTGPYSMASGPFALKLYPRVD